MSRITLDEAIKIGEDSNNQNAKVVELLSDLGYNPLKNSEYDTISKIADDFWEQIVANANEKGKLFIIRWICDDQD